ncbi:MAG: hypothetical protein IT348_08935 [Candidatus Eisenbacteria bacterium]|nr:hypothetical protein [Candidatus Eisenbacteria bacterium]
MKIRLLLAALSLVLAASPALGAGVNLAWNDCGQAGQVNEAFACNTNTGAHVLVGSFVPPAGTTAITGEEIVIRLVSASNPYPSWWHFKNTGSCRQSSLAANADFIAGPYSCADYWAGQAAGGIASYQVFSSSIPTRAKLLMVFAVPPNLAMPVNEELEYYAFKLSINNAKTVGTGACDGCLDPVCIVLNEIKLTQPVGVGNYRLQNPAYSYYATWQGGVVSGGCPAATPARNRTWGAVKSLRP